MVWKDRKNKEKISELESTIQSLNDLLNNRSTRITELESSLEYWKTEFVREVSKLEHSIDHLKAINEQTSQSNKQLQESVEYWKAKKADESLEASLKKWMDEYYKLFEDHKKEQKSKQDEWKRLEEEKKSLESEWNRLREERQRFSPKHTLTEESAEQLLKLIEQKCKSVTYESYRSFVYRQFKKEASFEELDMFDEHFTQGIEFENNFQGGIIFNNGMHQIWLNDQMYFCESLWNCNIKYDLHEECRNWCFKPIINECKLMLKLDKDKNIWTISPPRAIK